MKSLFLAASLALAACASSSEPTSASDSDLSSDDAVPGVAVDATYNRAVTGIPTYGSDATTPFLSLRVRVADGEVRAAHPGFDGLERPFVLVPHAGGASERVELRFTGTGEEGYIELHPVDDYELAPQKLTEADLAVVIAKGVTIGLDTNVGTLSATVPVTQQHD